MNYTEKRLEDVEKILKGFDGMIGSKQKLKDLFSTSIDQAIAEERERVVGKIENKRADLQREMRKLDYEGEDYLNSPVGLGHCYLKRLGDLKEVKDDLLSSLDKPLTDKE